MRIYRLMLLALSGLMILGCSLPGGAPGAPQPSPDRSYSRDFPSLPAEPLAAEEARELLVSYYTAGYTEDALRWTTGPEREYMAAVLAQWQAGTPGQVRQWSAGPGSAVVIQESNSLSAVAALAYTNMATGREESMLFRFERPGERWLVAGHTDPAGRWWPDNK